MDNNPPSDNPGSPLGNKHTIEISCQASRTIRPGNKLRHISRMMFRMIRIAVRTPGWIEVTASACAVRRAAITFIVNMETMHPRRQALHFSHNPNLVPGLRKRNNARNGIALRCVQHSFGAWRSTTDQPPVTPGQQAAGAQH